MCKMNQLDSETQGLIVWFPAEAKLERGTGYLQHHFQISCHVVTVWSKTIIIILNSFVIHFLMFSVLS